MTCELFLRLFIKYVQAHSTWSALRVGINLGEVRMDMFSKIRVFGWMAALTVIMGLAVVALPQAGSDSKESGKAGVKKISRMIVTVEGELQVLNREGSDSKDGTRPLGVKVIKATDTKGNELTNLKGETLKLAVSAKTKALAAKHSSGEICFLNPKDSLRQSRCLRC